jgi:hypothetical protein
VASGLSERKREPVIRDPAWIDDDDDDYDGDPPEDWDKRIPPWQRFPPDEPPRIPLSVR